MKNVVFMILLSFVVNYCKAQTGSTFFNSKGIAVRGYDVVAYFTDKAAVEGKKEFVFNWEATDWYFKNQENLEAFKANPSKYAPQFGGYCAYGVSENHKSPTDPNAFTIVDDKLYLNYSLKVKELWIKDTKGRIEKGESNWKNLKNKNE